MVLLSVQGMDVAVIARVAFTSEDRVRDVIRNFNADGFALLYPKYKGGHPPKFTLAQRREIKKIAKSKPRAKSPIGGPRPRMRATYTRIVDRANAA
jgi:transposase